LSLLSSCCMMDRLFIATRFVLSNTHGHYGN
jgi:hypothetical protein